MSHVGQWIILYSLSCSKFIIESLSEVYSSVKVVVKME